MNEKARDAIDDIVDQFVNGLTARQPALKEIQMDAHIRQHAEELKAKLREHIEDNR